MRPGRPLRRSEVWLREAPGEIAIYNPRDGGVHLLNETALAIWQLCDGETEPAEMVDAICELSKLPHEVVEEDVSRILSEFEAAGLLEWRE